MENRQIVDDIINKMKTYHPSKDFSLIEKAYEVAEREHGTQLRKSGEPYIVHPLQVAYILAELEMDKETVAAGILHDVIEDTEITYDELAKLFSEEIAILVDGVTKLGKIEYFSKEEVQAENFRKMFLAMAADIRVILIKLADRLHNMRTLQFMTPKKQQEKAQETLDIYAPIAQRLGIHIIGTELEDLSLKYLKPAVYEDLADKVERKQEDRSEFVAELVEDIASHIENGGIKNADVEGRRKHYYSIYRKMVSQNKTLDQIYDLFAVRVIVNTVKDCYGVLGIIHEMYKPMPGRFKDYIAMPKANMYKSLHNTLIGTDGLPFEVQIRTQEMHRAAEHGIAAHWRYKSSGDEMGSAEEEKLSWLRQILEWQNDLSDGEEFMTALKFDLDVHSNLVYAFTPKGDVKELPMGSTPIDFAYLIHSAVGNRMVGARVSGKIVTFDYKIKNGDIIDIITSNNSKGPSRDWLNMAKSQQARNKINQWYKKEFKEENIVKGKELLEKEAKRKALVLSELMRPKWMELVVEKYGFNDWEALCAAIGHGGLKEGQVLNRLNEELLKEKEKNTTAENVLQEISKTADSPVKHQQGGVVVIKDSDFETSYRLSRCCNPVPGDEIVGFVTRGRGVSIHRTDCVNIIHLEADERRRLLEVEWPSVNEKSDLSFFAEIKVTADDRIGLIVDVSKVFRDEEINVHNLSTRVTKTGEAIFDIVMEIRNRKQLDKVVKRIKNLPDVYTIERVTT